jgi:hypothetical protein
MSLPELPNGQPGTHGVESVGLVLSAFQARAASQKDRDRDEYPTLLVQSWQHRRVLCKSRTPWGSGDHHGPFCRNLGRLACHDLDATATCYEAGRNGLADDPVDHGVGRARRCEKAYLSHQSPCRLCLVQSHCRGTTNRCQA